MITYLKTLRIVKKDIISSGSSTGDLKQIFLFFFAAQWLLYLDKKSYYQQ